MTVTSLVVVVAPRTGKIFKKAFFDRGENLPQNDILHLANRQKSLEFNIDEKLTFQKRAWHLKG